MSKLKDKLYQLLRRSEKIFKTDMVYFFHGSFWLTTGQFFSGLIAFLTSIAFANWLNPEIYGTYRYLLSAYSILALLAMPGMGVAVTQSVSRGFDQSLISGVKEKKRWGIFGLLVSVIVGAFYFFIKNEPTIAWGFIIMGIAIPIIEPYSLYVNFLEGKKKFRASAVSDMAYNLLYSCSITATLFFAPRLFPLLIVYFGAFAVFRFIIFKKIESTIEQSDETDTEIKSYAKKTNLFHIFSALSLYLDKIILFQILGPVDVAIFSFAQAIPERIKSLFRSTRALSLPKFANKTKAEIQQTIYRKLGWLTLGAIVAAGLYILIAPFVFKYLFPQYLESIAFSQVIAISTVYVISYPIGALLMAHKKVKESFKISAYSLIAGTITLLIFAPSLRVWGGVIGLSVNRLVTAVMSLYYLNKED